MSGPESAPVLRWLLIALAVVAGLAVSVSASVLAAFEAAEWAGVRPGGWNWQYLPALYGGLVWGAVGFGVVCPLLYWRSRLAVMPAIAVAVLIVVAAAFVLSLVGHLLLGPA